MGRLSSLPIASSEVEVSIWLSIEFRFVTVGVQFKEEKTKELPRLSGIPS